MTVIAIKNQLIKAINDYQNEKIKLSQLRLIANDLLYQFLSLKGNHNQDEQLYWLLDELDDLDFNLRFDPQKAAATLINAFKYAKSNHV